MTAFIFLLVLLVVFIAAVIAELSMVQMEKCEHEHFAEYRSRKIKQCIDCGLEVSIDATNW